MQEVELNIFQRSAASKGETKRLRRSGHIPFVMYAKGKETETGYINKVQFEAIIRNLRPGFLPTTIVSLKEENGKKRKAIVRDIQYKVTNYDVLHLDFQILDELEKVYVKVPVECLNIIDCEGIKLGGFLQYVARHVEVSCLPKDIPTHFELDVKELGIRQTKRVKDISIPNGVKPVLSPDDVVVTVVKKGA